MSGAMAMIEMISLAVVMMVMVEELEGERARVTLDVRYDGDGIMMVVMRMNI